MLRVHVHVRHVLRQPDVFLHVRLVEDKEEQVKAGKKCRRQVYVFRRGVARIVPPVRRVRRREDRRPRVQRRRDPSLADADGLLLHDLVYRRPIDFIHLVELVNAADALDYFCGRHFHVRISGWRTGKKDTATVGSIGREGQLRLLTLSARTKAPPSSTISSVTGSLITAAVNPTPEEPRPVV
ncbi:MAG: hypothetical protein BJ554DRAFT_601 [Olpidium bornovanus]|uniref:Uncharacterized protein n=1 Tax=Olpidium bornovanus TaxID=278681 RepID=A0A8H8DM20_9FUNG|nr:MAG: hypothetical protein BJ554DRAFT_601 [Olpidium bornovanus]